MAKSEIERSIRKCKKCKAKTFHFKTAKRMTLAGFIGHMIAVLLTGGLYLIPLLFIILFGNKGKWECYVCSPIYAQQVGRALRPSKKDCQFLDFDEV